MIPSRKVDENPERTGDLRVPPELLYQILKITCQRSPTHFLDLLLLSKGIGAVVWSDCLQHIPVRLRTDSQTRSFCRLLVAKPGLGRSISYLWMDARPMEDQHSFPERHPTGIDHNQWHLSTVQHRIIEETTGITALVCPHSVFSHICRRELELGINLYGKLKEVGIISGAAHGWDIRQLQLYKQITHLSLFEVVEGTSPFHCKTLPALEAFSCQGHAAETSSPTKKAAAARSTARHARGWNDEWTHLPLLVNVVMNVHHDFLEGAEYVRKGKAWIFVRVGKLDHYERWLHRLQGCEGTWEHRY